MSIDLSQDYSEIKNKLSAYLTVLENDENEKRLKKSQDGDAQNIDLSDIKRTLTESSSGITKSIKTVKTQFDELLDIFKYTLPNNQTSN